MSNFTYTDVLKNGDWGDYTKPTILEHTYGSNETFAKRYRRVIFIQNDNEDVGNVDDDMYFEVGVDSFKVIVQGASPSDLMQIINQMRRIHRVYMRTNSQMIIEFTTAASKKVERPTTRIRSEFKLIMKRTPDVNT